MARADKLIEVIRTVHAKDSLPFITDLQFPVAENSDVERLDEGRWISGRHPNNIRLDQPTHLQGNGQQHAHVQGRNGKDYVIVNLDGTSSHGMKGKLHDKDANALRAAKYKIPSNNIIEWFEMNDQTSRLLLG